MVPERTRTTAQATAEGLRLFIANVPWHIREDTLQRDFGECGVVEDLFLCRDPQGNSRGRGFVTFREKAAVEAALKYDNTDYAGRTISVKIAEGRTKDEGKEEKKAEGAKAEGAKDGTKAKAKVQEAKEFPKEKPKGCRSICLKNIGNATETDVKQFFRRLLIQSVRVVTDRATKKPRGIAFVDFQKESEVEKAMEKRGQELKGLAVEMSYEAPRDRPRPERCMAVAVKKLPPEAEETEVKKLFKGLKSMDSVRVIRDKAGSCNGLAFVTFSNEADVEEAILRDGMKVGGNVVFICYETKGRKRVIEAKKKADELGLPPPEPKAQKDKGKLSKKKKKSAVGAEVVDDKAQEEVQADSSESTKTMNKKGVKRKGDAVEAAGDVEEKAKKKRTGAKRKAAAESAAPAPAAVKRAGKRRKKSLAQDEAAAEEE